VQNSHRGELLIFRPESVGPKAPFEKKRRRQTEGSLNKQNGLEKILDLSVCGHLGEKGNAVASVRCFKTLNANLPNTTRGGTRGHKYNSEGVARGGEGNLASTNNTTNAEATSSHPLAKIAQHKSGGETGG